MAYTFRGGIHAAEHKNTAHTRVTELPPPREVRILLSQHIGAPCRPLVAVGDEVLRGQMIGDVTGGLGCPVHSSVSGRVKAIVPMRNAMGAAVEAVVIENDGQGRNDPSITYSNRNLAETSPEEIIEIVRRAGISGMGGASFPTYAKISSAIGRVDTMIINAAECEPFITANNRLINEHPEAVVSGARVLLHALGLKQGLIAIEDNKPHSIAILSGLTAESDDLRVCVMKTKYPQGDERQLIFALTGRELPPGKLPADVGCVVFNAETAASVYRAFNSNMPLIERIVTVDGDCVREPKNLMVPIGTPIRELIDFCGGLTKTPKTVINGGPMMGFAQWDIDAPVTKGTSAILVFSEAMKHTSDPDAECIRCGRCVRGCPMHLMPVYLAAYARRGMFEDARRVGAMNCVECGSCSYVCPAGVPIVQYIRVAKNALRAAQATQKK